MRGTGETRGQGGIEETRGQGWIEETRGQGGMGLRRYEVRGRSKRGKQDPRGIDANEVHEALRKESSGRN